MVETLVAGTVTTLLGLFLGLLGFSITITEVNGRAGPLPIVTPIDWRLVAIGLVSWIGGSFLMVVGGNVMGVW